jgi:hypothetical protein
MLRLVAALMLPVVACAQETAVVSASLDRLAWLAGQWRLEKNGRVVDEQWMAPAGGLMLGMSRTVTKGRVLEYEFLQIREGPGGELFFVAQPARQKEAAFKLVTQSDTEVTFENREHDFPQVIGYGLRTDGSLLAYIEGPKADGTIRRIEYSYRRLPP